MENRNGLVVDLQMDVADGRAERRNALDLVDDNLPGTKRITLGGDKGYDTRDFVAECRARNITPHVAQNITKHRGSMIDGRTANQPGYAVSQQKRKRIEQVFGWGKTVGRIRQAMYRGLERVDQLFVLTQVGYNLTRMRTLAG